MQQPEDPQRLHCWYTVWFFRWLCLSLRCPFIWLIVGTPYRRYYNLRQEQRKIKQKDILWPKQRRNSENKFPPSIIYIEFDRMAQIRDRWQPDKPHKNRRIARHEYYSTRMGSCLKDCQRDYKTSPHCIKSSHWGFPQCQTKQTIKIHNTENKPISTTW